MKREKIAKMQVRMKKKLKQAKKRKINLEVKKIRIIRVMRKMMIRKRAIVVECC